MYIKIPSFQLYPNNHHEKQILHSTFLAIQQTTNHKNTTCFQPKVLHNVDKSVWFYTSLESWVRKRAAVQIRRCWVIWPSKKSYLEPVSLNAKWFRCRASIHSLEGAGSFMECNSWLLAGRRLGVHEAHHCPFKNPLLTPGYFVLGGGSPLNSHDTSWTLMFYVSFLGAPVMTSSQFQCGWGKISRVLQVVCKFSYSFANLQAMWIFNQ